MTKLLVYAKWCRKQHTYSKKKAVSSQAEEDSGLRFSSASVLVPSSGFAENTALARKTVSCCRSFRGALKSLSSYFLAALIVSGFGAYVKQASSRHDRGVRMILTSLSDNQGGESPVRRLGAFANARLRKLHFCWWVFLCFACLLGISEGRPIQWYSFPLQNPLSTTPPRPGPTPHDGPETDPMTDLKRTQNPERDRNGPETDRNQVLWGGRGGVGTRVGAMGGLWGKKKITRPVA